MSRDITQAPSAGLEPALPAPEAGALSAELRGRVDRCGFVERRTDVTTVVADVRRTRRDEPRPLASGRMSGRSEWSSDQVPRPDPGPIERRLLPDSASVDEDGRLSVGGADLVELAHRFGTP